MTVSPAKNSGAGRGGGSDGSATEAATEQRRRQRWRQEWGGDKACELVVWDQEQCLTWREGLPRRLEVSTM